MGIEIDLLRNYPRTKRNLAERESLKTPENRALARQFGKDYFDGSRETGYGGFSYNSRFWQPVIPDLVEHFGITPESAILDVGCGKGFMLFDFQQLVPGVTVSGIDVSQYAIDNSVPEVRSHLSLGNATQLPFEDKSFDFVFAINTIHNLEPEPCARALREIQRVARVGSFITVDAYRDASEKRRMYAWNLTAETIMSVEEWVGFFDDAGYTGDYFWFIP
jgi:ubiquinone/menaquinone biosynthesis C-methylase UbiE